MKSTRKKKRSGVIAIKQSLRRLSEEFAAAALHLVIGGGLRLDIIRCAPVNNGTLECCLLSVWTGAKPHAGPDTKIFYKPALIDFREGI